MNKSILIASLIPLLCILFWFYSGEHAKIPPPTSTAQTDKGTSQPPFAQTANTSSKEKPAIKNADINQMELALLAAEAKALNPEGERKTLNFVMERREPGYQALFAEWKLDKATADKVRMIIYDRELEQRLWMMKPEASAPATWRASHSAKKAMKLLKDSELSNLIGPDRLKRLLQVDAKVLEEMKNSAND